MVAGQRSRSKSRRSEDAGGKFAQQISQNSFGKTSHRRIFNLSKTRSNLCKSQVVFAPFDAVQGGVRKTSFFGELDV